MWTIGLVLIEPDERNNGLGKAVHKALSEWAAGFGAEFLQIGVLQDNTKAIKFWLGLGYRKIDEKEMSFGSKTHLVDIMGLKR